MCVPGTHPNAGEGADEVDVVGLYKILYNRWMIDYVLHFFQKKTQKTRKADLDLAGQRYRDLLEERPS